LRRIDGCLKITAMLEERGRSRLDVYVHDPGALRRMKANR
jgi:hypothetical protein